MRSIRTRLAIAVAVFSALLVGALAFAPLVGSTPISLARVFDRLAHPSTLVSAVLLGVASTSRTLAASALRLNGLGMKCMS